MSKVDFKFKTPTEMKRYLGPYLPKGAEITGVTLKVLNKHKSNPSRAIVRRAYLQVLFKVFGENHQMPILIHSLVKH